jgi:hypothetical protein
MAVSISGTTLTFNDATTMTTAATAYPGPRSQLFTSSGTFTVPTGITSVLVTVVGGGSGNNTTYNPQGGQGGYAVGNVSVTPGASISITVGTGSAGVSGNAGNAANSSSFGASISATGGGATTNQSGTVGVGSSGTIMNSQSSALLGTVRGDGAGRPPFFAGVSSRVANSNQSASPAYSANSVYTPGAIGYSANACSPTPVGGVGGAVLVEY